MRKTHVGTCLVGLLLVVAPARATFLGNPIIITELVGEADTIIVGKVTKVQNKLIKVLPTRRAPKKEAYQLVEVTVLEAIQGAKGLTSLQIGVRCAESKLPNGKPFVYVTLVKGQEACFFLTRHQGGKFYELGLSNIIRKELNPSFDKDLALTKNCVQLLAAADKSLKSKLAENRILTAAMLIRQYRGPAPFLWDTKVAGKKTPKEEPISAEQSKLILHALMEADWSLAKEPSASPNHPATLFRRLGLTAKDGWKLKQKRVNPLDGRAGYQTHLELTRAAKKWLKANADTYRIKRIVTEMHGKKDPVQEKTERDGGKVKVSGNKKKDKAARGKGEKDRTERQAFRAAAKLKLIKSLINSGKTDIGKMRLKQLIKEFPDTPAAEEAKKLLKYLD
jgi:hypothetical protein